MEQFNKALSFILGLVVVAVFIIVASGKFKFPGITIPTAQKTATNVTPTTTPRVTPKPTAKPWFSFNQPTAKPTVKPKAQPTSSLKNNTYGKGGVQQQPKQQDPNYHAYSGSTLPTSIPSTGIPIVLFPLLGTSLITGIFMKKTGKKE